MLSRADFPKRSELRAGLLLGREPGLELTVREQVVVAAFAARAAARAAQSATDQLSDARKERSDRQAAGITAWSDGKPEPLVLNTSSSPVFAVVVETPNGVYRWPILPPGPVPIRAIAKEHHRVAMPPAPEQPAVAEEPPPAPEQPAVAEEPLPSEDRPRILSITYRDAARVWWRRDDNGELTRLDGAPADPTQ